MVWAHHEPDLLVRWSQGRRERTKDDSKPESSKRLFIPACQTRSQAWEGRGTWLASHHICLLSPKLVLSYTNFTSPAHSPQRFRKPKKDQAKEEIAS